MEDRRHNDIEILDKLSDIKTEIVEAKISSAKIAILVEERNISAVAWRTDVCRKFDKIFTWLETLPCKERRGMYTSIKSQLAVMWVFVSGVMIALFIEWFRK